mgnify:FL=1|tara:strand:+ start:1643 stop:1858 length:216 start_codon:yes stop_codon:yes gene_type:complete
MIAYDSPDQIALFRLKSLRGALKLEILGMKRNGRSVYSIVKEEFGFKGNKQKVLKQLELKIEEITLANALN